MAFKIINVRIPQQNAGILSKIRSFRNVCGKLLGPNFGLIPAFAGMDIERSPHISDQKRASLNFMTGGDNNSGGNQHLFIIQQNNQGNRFLKQNRYYEARECFLRILRLQPDDIPAMDGLARAYLGERDYEHTIDVYERLLEKNPDDYRAKYGLARTYVYMGQPENAKSLLKEVFKDRPTDVHALDMLGRIYFSERSFTLAKYYYNEILAKCNDRDIPAMNQLGEIAIFEDDYPLARDYFGRILELRPGDIIAKNGLGKVAWAEGDYDLADNIFTTILLNYPNDIVALYGRGRVAAATGKHYIAITLFKKILAISPRDHEALEWLGMVHMAIRDYPLAEEFFHGINESEIIGRLDFSGFAPSRHFIDKCGLYKILLTDLIATLEKAYYLTLKTGNRGDLYLILNGSVYHLCLDLTSRTLITIIKICHALPPKASMRTGSE